jgi:hypothetical protein
MNGFFKNMNVFLVGFGCGLLYVNSYLNRKTVMRMLNDVHMYERAERIALRNSPHREPLSGISWAMIAKSAKEKALFLNKDIDNYTNTVFYKRVFVKLEYNSESPMHALLYWINSINPEKF